jgi:hypothetical protein
MKTLRLSLTLLAAAFVSALVAHAQNQPTEATLLKVVGTVTISMPDGSTTPAVEGMKLPQGAKVLTGKDGEARILAHDGIVAVVDANTDATINKLSVSADGTRNAEIGMTHGSIASSIDKTKKNNYGIRTPKGVAAARGTAYSVTIAGTTYTIAVGAGEVGAGGQTISPGQVQVATATGTQVVALASLVSSDTATAAKVVALISTAAAAQSTTQAVEVVQTLAAAAGSGTAATQVVAAAASAASATAATQGGADATTVTQQIVNAAVQGAVSAGNTQAAGAIVTTTAVAVTTATASSGTPVDAVKSSATTLASTLATTVNNQETGALKGTGVVVNTTNISTAIQNTTISTSSIGQAPTATSTATTASTTVTTTTTTTTTTPAGQTQPQQQQQQVTTTPTTPVIDPGTVSVSGGK